MTCIINERMMELKGMTPLDRRNIAQQQLDTLAASHPEPQERLKALEDVLGEKFWEKSR